MLIGKRIMKDKIKRVYCDTYQEMTRQFDSEPPIQPTDIVMLGDSQTQFGGNWNKRLLGTDSGPYINRGIAGDDTSGIYDRLHQVLPFHPAAIYFLAGINDISHGLNPEEVASGIFRIVEEISVQCPDTRLFLQSLLPINEHFHQWKLLEGKTDTIVQVNHLIRQRADKRHIPFLNLFPLFTLSDSHIMRPELTVDGLHLTEKGYEIWVHELKGSFSTPEKD
jgi:lysophospholipase L1-like esterase